MIVPVHALNPFARPQPTFKGQTQQPVSHTPHISQHDTQPSLPFIPLPFGGTSILTASILRFGDANPRKYESLKEIEAEDRLETPSGKQKTAGRAKDFDDYVRYTPHNTPCPLSTWHTLAASFAQKYHQYNASVLEQYLNRDRGETVRYSIPWINNEVRALGEVPYTVFDTETTGLDTPRKMKRVRLETADLKGYHRIIQIASSKVDADHRVDHSEDINTLVHPGDDGQGNMFPIDEGASAVHGIFEEDLADEEKIEDFIRKFRNDVLGTTGLVVAYNAKFDIYFLNSAINRFNLKFAKERGGKLRRLDPALVLDPFVLMQRIHPFVTTRKRLGDHYELMMGRDLENKHDAQADVDGTVDILKYAFKYLQRHAIPLEWAQAAEKIIDARVKNRNWKPHEKAFMVADMVRRHRAMFAEKIAVENPEPLKIVDILQFQHGAAVYHRGTELPKLDISLNQFGWDGSKRWMDADDTFDREVVEELRTERDQENRELLVAIFRDQINKEALGKVANRIHVAEKTKFKEAAATRHEHKIQQELLGVMDETLFKLFLTPPDPDQARGKLPGKNADAAIGKLKKGIEKHVTDFVADKLKDAKGRKPATNSKFYTKDIPQLVDDMYAKLRDMEDELGERFFYAKVELTDEEPLISPAIYQTVARVHDKLGSTSERPEIQRYQRRVDLTSVGK